MKNLVLVFTLFNILLISCGSEGRKEDVKEEEVNGDVNENNNLKTTKEFPTDPRIYFDTLNSQKAEGISSEQIQVSANWNFKLQEFADNSKIICATSENGESITFEWNWEEKKYKPVALTPEIAKGVSFKQIKQSAYEAESSKSIEVFTNNIQELDVPDVKNHPLNNTTDIEVANDSIYITTTKGTLSYLNVNNTTEITGEGDMDNFSIYIRHIGEDYILLAEFSYGGPDLKLINLTTGNEFLIAHSATHNLHISPNLQHIAISLDGGGFDANYNPTGFIKLYSIEGEIPELIFLSKLGPIGHKSDLKWVSNEQVLLSTLCQAYSFSFEKEEPSQVVYQQFSDLLKNHQFKEASILFNKYNIDINEYYDVNISEDRTSLQANRRLPEAVAKCDAKLIDFLLSLDADPSLSSISIYVDPYNYSDENNEIPEDIDMNQMDISKLKEVYDFVETPTIASALSCKDSTSFYLLVNSDKMVAEEYSPLVLEGAIKWRDSVLLNKLLKAGGRINFVPQTDDLEILKMLVPYTDGKFFGNLELVEFGAEASDLMNAVSKGYKDMVWFMLETGAEPNECLPNPYKPSNKDGMLPAITALSIAKDGYKENNAKYEELKGVADNAATRYKEKAMTFSKIMDLLQKYGAKDVKWCSSAP